ncbi:hypothetical protein HDK90DRAFT_546112, partial [Phyllosticta capitalensis]
MFWSQDNCAAPDRYRIPVYPESRSHRREMSSETQIVVHLAGELVPVVEVVGFFHLGCFLIVFTFNLHLFLESADELLFRSEPLRVELRMQVPAFARRVSLYATHLALILPLGLLYLIELESAPEIEKINGHFGQLRELPTPQCGQGPNRVHGDTTILDQVYECKDFDVLGNLNASIETVRKGRVPLFQEFLKLCAVPLQSMPALIEREFVDRRFFELLNKVAEYVMSGLQTKFPDILRNGSTYQRPSLVLLVAPFRPTNENTLPCRIVQIRLQRILWRRIVVLEMCPEPSLFEVHLQISHPRFEVFGAFQYRASVSSH